MSQDMLDELVAHAREEAPNECCGIVAVASDHAQAAHDRRATHVHRTVNTAASPLKFEVDGKQLIGLIDAIEADGQELGAIYHSHTRTAPYPSQTDINFAANWPGMEWVIVGIADREAPDIHSYLIDGGQVTEVALERDSDQR